MKKILSLGLLLASIAFTGTFASAQSYNSSQQDRYNNDRNQRDNDRRDDRNDRNWNNRRVRITTQTRIVRQGRRTFRETIEIKRFPNGRTQTRVISRVRIDR